MHYFLISISPLRCYYLMLLQTSQISILLQRTTSHERQCHIRYWISARLKEMRHIGIVSIERTLKKLGGGEKSSTFFYWAIFAFSLLSSLMSVKCSLIHIYSRHAFCHGDLQKYTYYIYLLSSYLDLGKNLALPFTFFEYCT